MICTFCGSENRSENRFCGMCGVRLERRKTERRVEPHSNPKCPACGHINEAGYKFCGMCGVRVERRIQERRGADERANAMANAQLPTPELRNARTSNVAAKPAPPAPKSPVAEAQPPVKEPAPVEKTRTPAGSIFVNNEPPRSTGSIGGPSFLGLNSDAGSDGDYLLEEEKSGGGLRTLVLLVILAAILGLIFVQWRSGFKANPRSQSSKPNPTENAQAQSSTPASAAAASHNPDELHPSSASGKKTGDGSARKTGDSLTGDPASKAGDAQTADTPTGDPSSTQAENSKRASARQQEASSQPDDDASQQEEETPARDGGPIKTETARDVPAARQPPSAALLKAQRYLQGRGVPQNCEQGLMYLKAATDQNDPHAAVQMGALYSSGLCVPQDRVKAYKWFASARDLDPQNRWIDRNLNVLWSQMSPDERRQVQQ